MPSRSDYLKHIFTGIIFRSIIFFFLLLLLYYYFTITDRRTKAQSIGEKKDQSDRQSGQSWEKRTKFSSYIINVD